MLSLSDCLCFNKIMKKSENSPVWYKDLPISLPLWSVGILLTEVRRKLSYLEYVFKQKLLEQNKGEYQGRDGFVRIVRKKCLINLAISELKT